MREVEEKKNEAITIAGEHSEEKPKNRIILGCMTFGPDPSTGARINTLEETSQILNYFTTKGYTEVDTARQYCGCVAERWLRSSLQLLARGGSPLPHIQNITCSTKLYPTKPGMHLPESIEDNLSISLNELGTDCVDIYYLHAPDRSVPWGVTLQKVDELYKRGKFKTLGLSNYTAFEVAEICLLCSERGWVKPRVYQGMYNCITRGIEKELVVVCRKWGVDIVVYNPLAGGLLVGEFIPEMVLGGKTTEGDDEEEEGVVEFNVPETGRFSNVHPPQGSAYRKRYFTKPYFKALMILKKVSERHGISSAEISLRWLVHHSALRMRNNSKYDENDAGARGGNDGILLGISSLQQLRENIENLEKGPLPAEIVKGVDRAWKEVRGDAPDYWHLKLEYGYDTTKEY